MNINNLNQNIFEIEDTIEDNPLIFFSKEELDNHNNNLKSVNVELIGDKTIIAQTIQLLAYIRHAVRNNMNTNINVQIKTTVANAPFMLTANGMQVPDLVTVNTAQIN